MRELAFPSGVFSPWVSSKGAFAPAALNLAMSASSATFDLVTKWRPIADAFAVFQNECGSLVQCADSVFGEVDSIRGELVARARELQRLEEQLVHREGQLAEQRSDFARLSSQFDQQAACLAETTEELGRLREEVTKGAPPATLAADTARLALEQAGEAWQRDRAEIMERLNALSIMQQTGSNDGEAVQAFCHELTEIHELIGNSHAQTRAALDKQLAHFDERLVSLAQASTATNSSDESLSRLSSSLAELRDELTRVQSQATSTASETQNELLSRLDALAESSRPAAAESPLLAEILQKLGETRQSLESVRQQGAEQAQTHESIVAALRAEIEQLRSALQEAPRSAGPSATDEAIASLRAELEAQRQTSEDARQQAQRQETERALLEAELDRVRTQAAQWRLQHEEETAHHHEEEQRWHEELQDLRQLIRQAAASMGAASPAEMVTPASVKSADAPEPSDAVANSLLAQFAKLQKDSARRRTRGQ